MSGRMVGVKRIAIAGTTGLMLVASGCASLSQEDLDIALDAMRAEVQTEINATQSQVSATNNRVSALESRVGTLERDLASLMVEFETTVETLEGALRFSAPVHFAYDSDELRLDDTGFLDRFASVVRTHYPDATVTVEGFSDPAGSAAYNLELSQRRANAVMAYLGETGGLAAERLRAVGYGEEPSRLLVPEGWGENGIENRRVALVIDYLPRSGAMSPAMDS